MELRERICRWSLSFQKYEFKVIDKPSKVNAGPNDLSQVIYLKEAWNVNKNLPYAQLFHMDMVDNYFTKIVSFLTMGTIPQEYTMAPKKKKKTSSQGCRLLTHDGMFV